MLWLIVDLSPAAQASPALALCFCAWALVEPTRYSFYLVKLLGLEPLYAHKWLRYSLFLVLYPAGILCEFGCLVYAFPGAAALRVRAGPGASAASDRGLPSPPPGGRRQAPAPRLAAAPRGSLSLGRPWSCSWPMPTRR